ncbi:MAG: DUF3413 domain-containing protein, partial [Rariglobus sp.]
MNDNLYSNNGDAKAAKPDGAGVIYHPRAFYAWSCLTTFVLLLVFVVRAAPESARSVAFAVAVAASYAVLFTLPSAGVLWVGRFAKGKIAIIVVAAVAVLLTTATQLLLAADYVVHGMFGFHINGFVLNLVTTPEGINSMGADAGSSRVYAAAAVACLALNIAMWQVLARGLAGRALAPALSPRVIKRAALVLVLITVGERLTYGFGHIRAWSDVLGVAATMPGYQPTTFRSLAKKLGIESRRQLSVDAPRPS